MENGTKPQLFAAECVRIPQKKRGRIAGMYLVGALMGNEKLMKKSKISMTEGMLMPYRKVIESAGK